MRRYQHAAQASGFADTLACASCLYLVSTHLHARLPQHVAEQLLHLRCHCWLVQQCLSQNIPKQLLHLPGNLVDVERGFRSNQGVLRESPTASRIIKQRRHGLLPGLRIIALDQQAIRFVVDQLAVHRNPRGNHWHTRQHGLDNRAGQAFIVRRKDEQIGNRQQNRDVAAVT